MISIHAPREGCDHSHRHETPAAAIISIHAPREGCDKPAPSVLLMYIISIHAPREGCDQNSTESLRGRLNFNPRTP